VTRAHGPGRASSITARLIASLTIGVTALWCLGAAFSTYLSSRELAEAFDGELRDSAMRLLPLASDDLSGRESDEALAVQNFVQAGRDMFSFELRDAQGKILLHPHESMAAAFQGDIRPGFASVGAFRLYATTDAPSGMTITVAETTKGRQDALFGAARGMLAPLLAVLPLSVLAIWLAVRSAMRPVARLSGDIAERSAGNLAPLDISDQPSELRPIAGAIATLMERLRQALDAERAFAANSAHELRTPIAGALAQTQRLIAQLEEPDDRRRGRDIEATLKRLAGLAEKLMQISRADAGVGLGGAARDLAPALDLVVADWARALHEPSRLRYAKAPDATLVSRMDIDAFAIAMRNLIENAVKHGSPDAPIEVCVEPGGVVRVVNGCAVVAPDALAKLKFRFMRGPGRSAGSGLGLAIAEAIVGQAGGVLELASPAPGRSDGFEARVTLNTLSPAS
jgi:two-component system, OmpR family, sensor kinase